jgi:putative Holliday junction resolvase
VVEDPDTNRGLDSLARLVTDREIDQIVVGLPLTMRGEEGEQARWARRFAERLAGRIRVPVAMHDERLTTRQAERSGGSAAPDSLAAAHLLESFLAARANR